jgi:Ca2+-binding RTX toxin-like protein
LLLVVAGSAQATTSAWVGYEPNECTDTYCTLPAATFLATGGPEVNTISTRVDSSGVTVTDSAGVDAGNSCTLVTPFSARCSILASDLHLRLSGGPGDDSISAESERTVEAIFDGGEGDDTLLGTEGGDILRGGQGNDTLLARGSPRDPDSLDGGPGADVLDGGAGGDELHYPGATGPVDVDLGRGTGNGQPGENDATAGIEDIRGVPAGSSLAGDAGANRLGLPGGSGTLAGRGGADVLTGGRTAAGGPGDDTFYDVSASIACDSGRDVVNGVAPTISLTCEEVYDPGFEMIGLREPRRLGDPFASTEMDCDPLSVAPRRLRRSCRGALVATRAGKRVAGGPVTVRWGRSRKVVARLGKGGQRLLKGRRTLAIRLSYSLRAPGTKARRGSFRTTLRRP